MSLALAWLIYGVILAVLAGVVVLIAVEVVLDARARWADYRASDEARALDRARNVTSKGAGR